MTGLHNQSLNVLFDGSNGQVQHLRDLAVGAASGDLGQDLGLPRSYPLSSQKPRDSGSVARAAAGYGLANGPQCHATLTGEVGQTEQLEVCQRLPKPCGRITPPVRVRTRSRKEAGEAAEKTSFESAECGIGGRKYRSCVTAFSAGGDRIS